LAVLKAKLLEECGELAPLGAAILLIGSLLLAVALQVNYVYATVDQIKDRTNTAVLAVAAGNAPAAHDGIREGESTARHFNGVTWSRAVSTAAVTQSLAAALNATADGPDLLRENGGRLTDIQVTAHNDDGGTLSFTTTMTVVIPLSVAGGVLPPVLQRVEVHTTYEPKF
jgi:hypothetical protein